MTLTRSHGFLQVLDSLFLAIVSVSLLVMQPSQLLKNFGVLRITLQDAAVGSLRELELRADLANESKSEE
jgi:hypothetical protein